MIPTPTSEPTICHEVHDAACSECVRHDETCGIRCAVCQERMCLWFGPEPAVNTCAAHDDECQSCNDDSRCPECKVERMRTRAEAAWEAAAEPGPYVDPRRDEWIDAAAEERADRRAYELARLEDREGMS